MENICGNSERRAAFLWWLRRKLLLLGAAEETTHSASLRVAEKIPKCFVTVNIVAKFFLTRGAARSSSLLDLFGGAGAQPENVLRDLRGDFARLCDEPLQPGLV